MPITAALSKAIGNVETDTSLLHRQSDRISALYIKRTKISMWLQVLNQAHLTPNRCFLFFLPFATVTPCWSCSPVYSECCSAGTKFFSRIKHACAVRYFRAGDKSRPMVYDVACVTSPRAACSSFLQPKNSGCRRQKRCRAPFADRCATIIYHHEHLFSLFTNHRDVPEIYLRNLPLFHTYLSDLRLTHSSRAEYYVEVFGSSVGRRHTRMTSSKYDACRHG